MCSIPVTISRVAANPRDVFTWFVGTELPGESCKTVCETTFQGYCDSTADWPDSEPELKAIAKEYGIPCDSFCQRTDIGSAPTFIPPNNGERYACSSTGEEATISQCIFGNGKGVLPRCQRRFRPTGHSPRIQICPCRYATTSTTTTSTSTTTTGKILSTSSTTTNQTITFATTPSTIATTSPTPTTTVSSSETTRPSPTTTATTTATITASNPTTTTATTTATEPKIEPEFYISFPPYPVTTISPVNMNLVVVVVTIAGSVLGVFLMGVVIFLVACAMITRRRNANANRAGGNNPAGPGVNHPPNHRPHHNPNQAPHGHGPYSRHLSPGSTMGSEYSNRSGEHYDPGSGFELRSNFSGDDPSVGSFGSSVHHTHTNTYTVVRRDGSVYSDPVYPDEAPTTDEIYDN